MIRFTDSVTGITAEQLVGFFAGWVNPPSPETHLRLLTTSDCVVLAIDRDTAQVVGFITAISDRVLCAYIPFLEVLPAHQHRGVGQELMRRMLDKLRGLYMVDLCCDPALEPFYARFGMQRAMAMISRNCDGQSGSALDAPHDRAESMDRSAQPHRSWA